MSDVLPCIACSTANMVALSGCVSGLHENADRLKGERPFRTPDTDTLEYRIFELENGLRCVVVSDPESEKSACAMDVSSLCLSTRTISKRLP